MDDAVLMAVVESTGNLSTKFAGLLLLELAVRDDVVKHLAAVDKFKEHVPVIVCAHDIAQTADIGMVEEGHDGSFAGGSNLLGLVGSFFICSRLVVFGRSTRDDFTGNLEISALAKTKV